MKNLSSEKCNSSGKQGRRRCRPRITTSQDCSFNVAEARRQIVHALHLHRSSSSSSSSTTSTSSSSSSSTTSTSSSSSSTSSWSCGAERDIFGASSNCDFKMPNNNVTVNIVGSSQYYSLMESMPLPGPVWSTTAPSVLAAAAPPSAATMEALEFEWGENQASSYSWWLAFLKSLDRNNSTNEESKYPLGSSSSWLFGQKLQGNSCCKLEEPSVVPLAEGNDHQTPSPDEWLMFPTTEDGEGEIVIPHS